MAIEKENNNAIQQVLVMVINVFGNSEGNQKDTEFYVFILHFFFFMFQSEMEYKYVFMSYDHFFMVNTPLRLKQNIISLVW